MSGFSRSFKPTSYLSSLGGRRPAIPGRTLSGSSETSNMRAGSGMGDDDKPSHSGTAMPKSERGWIGGPPESQQPQRPCSSRFNSINNTRPVSTELPDVRKFDSAPISTPPTAPPLSAGRDRPGGYFPLHEDPNNRIHRSHPFPNDDDGERNSLVQSAHHHLPPPLQAQVAMNTTGPELNIPVASYIPIGVHDVALPMGKYYPSNYENRTPRGGRQPTRHNSSTSALSSSLGSPQMQQQRHQSKSDLDVKSRLQQYQRDMITQTRMVASEAMGAAAGRSPVPSSTSSSMSRNPFPFGSTMLIGAATMSTPISPRLHPLGSPGPVTPMTLEDSDGDYLSKGQATPRPDASGPTRLGGQQKPRR